MGNTATHILRANAFWLCTILCLIAFWWRIPAFAAPPLVDDRFWSDGFYHLEHLPHALRWTSEQATLYLPTQTTGGQRLVLSLQSGRTGDATQSSAVSVHLETQTSSARFEVAQAPRVYQLLVPNPTPLYLLTVTIIAPIFHVAGDNRVLGIVVTDAKAYAVRSSTALPWWALTSVALLIQHALLYWLLTRRLSPLLRFAVLSLWLPLLLPWLWVHGYDSRGVVVLGAATMGILQPYAVICVGTRVVKLSHIRNGWQALRRYHVLLYGILLLLPLLVYTLIAWNWNHSGVSTLTGDEPHYLLIAASLANDHDLALENNYREDAISHQFAAYTLDEEAHTIHSPRGWFSIHGIGLPLLLAVPLSFAGVLGAKVALALLIGLFPLVVFGMMCRVLGSQSSALAVSLTIGLGLPFLAASNQIYPDLLTGVLIFAIAVFLLWCTPVPSPGQWGTAWLVALLIAFLPWLHIKNIAPMLLLMLWYCCLHLRTPQRLRWIAPFSIIMLSLITFGLYNAFVYDSITGPYTAPLIYDPRQFMMILLGLHLDQSQGMFVQQPLLLLALLGIAPFWKHHRLGAVFVGIIYLSLIMPNAMFPNWYGGLTFSGRFAWSSVLLWLFPLAYALRSLLERSKTVVIKISTYSMAFQAYVALLWLPDQYYKRLYNNLALHSTRSIWEFQSSYIDLQSILPSFIDFDLYTKLSKNYIMIGLCCLLIVGSLVMHFHRPNLSVRKKRERDDSREQRS